MVLYSVLFMIRFLRSMGRFMRNYSTIIYKEKI
nr:MAG TPA: hypothetical protein [Caudoviricetes sp.]